MGGYDSTGDNEIIEAVLDGRTDEFEILLLRYRGYILKIVSGYVPSDRVQDLAQDVFIEAYRSLANFDRRAPFKRWLAGIASHICYDYWRRHYRTLEAPMSALGPEHLEWVEGVLADQANVLFNRAEKRKEAREILQWAMAGLCAEERMVLTLVHLEGFSAKEAAGILGWSVVYVKVRAHRSRNKLKKRIAAMLEEAG